MKTIFTRMLLVISILLYAQNGFTQTNQLANSQKSKGIITGIAYTNFTNGIISSDSTIDGVTENDSYKYGTHLGMAGFYAGYQDKTAFGHFGYDSSFQIFEGLNKSELYKSTLYKVQGNLILPINDFLSLSAGLNVSRLLTTYKYESYKENYNYDLALGAQAGLNLQIDNYTAHIGTHLIGVNTKSTSINSSYSVKGTVDGVIVQIGMIL